jgi:hypothetical protein
MFYNNFVFLILNNEGITAGPREDLNGYYLYRKASIITARGQKETLKYYTYYRVLDRKREG